MDASRGIPLKKKRYLLRDSDRSGFTYKNVELVNDNGSLVGGDEFDAPPPSNRIYPGEGDVSPGDTRSDYTSYSVPESLQPVVQYLNTASQISLDKKTDNAGNYTYNKSIVYICGSNSNVALSPILSLGPYTADTSTLFLAHLDTDYSDSSTVGATPTAVAMSSSDTIYKVGSGSGVFNGTSAYIKYPTNSIYRLASGDFTVECYAYFTSLTSTAKKAIICFWTGTGNQRSWYFCYSPSDNKLILQYSKSGLDIYSIASNKWIPELNAWYHVAFVRSSDNYYFFIDGNMHGNGSLPTRVKFFDGSSSFALGCVNPDATATHFFPGYLDEARVSNVARWTSNFNVSQISPSVHGDFLTLQGACSAVTIRNEYGVRLYSSFFSINSGSQLNLIYDATNGLWCETSRMGPNYSLQGEY